MSNVHLEAEIAALYSRVHELENKIDQLDKQLNGSKEFGKKSSNDYAKESESKMDSVTSDSEDHKKSLR